MKHSDYVTVNFGTCVTRKILDNLGSPDDKLKIIHIAGTNGKGSTAEFFTRILIADGKSAGTFTSPAVYDFYDQFKINGVPIKAETFESYFDRAEKAAEGLNATDFELETAAVLLAFCEENCEWAVIECGMGGLNDATNAINKKELAVITSVSLEHTEYLGKTIEEICAQKAGIIKNCHAVINALQPYEEAENYFKNTGGYFASRVTYAYGNEFWYGGDYFQMAVEGVEQAYNAATAIEGARYLGLSEKAIKDGVKSARFDGRVEKITAFGREYILDGAHNPAAFEPLVKVLKGLNRSEITLIFGCLKDKDIDGCLQKLSKVSENIIAVECKSPRKMPLEDIAAACRKRFGKVSTAESVTDALNKAFTKTIAVCGSFTLLKEAKQWIDREQ